MQYNDHLKLAALKAYARSLNQRAKNLGINGEIDAIILRHIILESGGKCAWCDSSIVKADFEIEHIMPLTRGGAHAEANLAVACPDCNRRKSDLHPAKFAQVCLNRTGIKTALILKILQDYEMTPVRQLSLFETPQPGNTPIEIPDDEDDSNPAPYIWNK